MQMKFHILLLYFNCLKLITLIRDIELQSHVLIRVFPIRFPPEFVKSGKSYNHIHAWDQKRSERKDGTDGFVLGRFCFRQTVVQHLPDLIVFKPHGLWRRKSAWL